MTPIKQAIILAAGQGHRLWPYTQDRPKCLLDIGGKTILEHQVHALLAQSIDRITVVTGYLGHMIRDVLGEQAQYITNQHYTETSSMYSLWLARGAALEGCLILNADVFFHPGILRILLTAPSPDALAVDFDAILAEEETKVLVTSERVCTLSKTLPQGDAENVGMIKLSSKGSQVLFAKIRALLHQPQQDMMVPYALNAIAPTYCLTAVSVYGLPWIEIDFPNDYHRACQVIYPAIYGDQQAALSPAIPGQ